jgi:hypothetical protein
MAIRIVAGSGGELALEHLALHREQLPRLASHFIGHAAAFNQFHLTKLPRAGVLQRAGDVESLHVPPMHPEDFLDGGVFGAPVGMLQHFLQRLHRATQQGTHLAIDALEITPLGAWRRGLQTRASRGDTGSLGR